MALQIGYPKCQYLRMIWAVPGNYLGIDEQMDKSIDSYIHKYTYIDKHIYIYIYVDIEIYIYICILHRPQHDALAKCARPLHCVRAPDRDQEKRGVEAEERPTGLAEGQGRVRA